MLISRFGHLPRCCASIPRRQSSQFQVLPGPTPGAIQIPKPLSPLAREPSEHFQMAGEPRDETLSYPDYFSVRKLFTVRDLLNARVHLGHASGTLDDRMRQFIFGKRFNQLIFDLDITAQYLQDALNVTAHIAARGGIFLFVSRNRNNALIVERAAMEAGEYSHTRYWHGGVFTNATSLFGAVTRLPDLIIFISTQNSVMDQHVAVEEAAKANIPTVGIVDTNCNPNLITYPVPGNDDSPVAVTLYCRLFKEAILMGKRRREQRLQQQEQAHIQR